MEKKCDEETQSDFLICLLELKFVRRSWMSGFQKAYHHSNHSAYKMIQTSLKYPQNRIILILKTCLGSTGAEITAVVLCFWETSFYLLTDTSHPQLLFESNFGFLKAMLSLSVRSCRARLVQLQQQHSRYAMSFFHYYRSHTKPYLLVSFSFFQQTLY